MSSQCVIHERSDYRYVYNSKADRFAALKSYKIAQKFGGYIILYYVL